MAASFLTPLLPPSDHASGDGAEHDRVRRALAADPALADRVTCDEQGHVILSGVGAGPPPRSLKERRRWELHVRLRLAAELGEAAAHGRVIRWVERQPQDRADLVVDTKT
jgi:hypothetical protein